MEPAAAGVGADGSPPRYQVAMARWGGRTVVIKRARHALDRAALQREADLLAAFSHPGVVELVDLRRRDGYDELVTAHAGSITLTDHRLRDLGAAAALLAAVAGTIADLHGVGRTHGSLESDHVVIAPTGRPVLCSFGASSPVSEAGRAADLRALAALARQVMASIPLRRGLAGRRQVRAFELAVGVCERGGTADEVGAALARVGGNDGVRGASIEDSTPRSEDRQLDRPEISGTRTWRSGAQQVPTPVAAGSQSHRATRVVAAGATATVGVLLTAWWLFGGSGSFRAAEREVIQRPVPASPERPGAASPSERTAPSLPSPHATARRSEPGEGAGVAEPTGCPTIRETCVPRGVEPQIIGNLVRVENVWYSAGRPGDIVVVGDFDCDGAVTPAVLRTADAALFVFDRWAALGEVVVIPPAALVPGAAALAVDREGACDAVVVLDTDGVSLHRTGTDS